ncbi:MAG TPA: MaoC family dehydratase [Candidatus Acidoferrum sp.]|nr:MaoC family dehydratase [Candidatus Acidoferrum sp.]
MPPFIVESVDGIKSFVGEEIGVSDWLVISQDRINAFADATGDRQWIHLNAERAKRESPFGKTIAHGFLTLSLISHLMQQTLQIRTGSRLAVNYGLNRVRFPAPVREGSRIRGHFTLASFKDLGDSYEAIFNCSVECEGLEKPACVAEWLVRYFK